MTTELIYKYAPLFGLGGWINISYYDNLSLEFIEQYQDKLDWAGISMRSIYIMDLITLYPKMILLKYVDCNDNLSYSYIRENWKELSELSDSDDIYSHCNFTMDLINELSDRVMYFDDDCLITNPNLSHEFITNHWNKFNNVYYLISCKNIKFDLLTTEQRDKLWTNMSFVRVLTIDQLEANIDKIKENYCD
jgi:hypothetical protein